jgi:hypothetical protein
VLERVKQVDQVKARLLNGPVINGGLTGKRVKGKLVAQGQAGGNNVLRRQQ